MIFDVKVLALDVDRKVDKMLAKLGEQEEEMKERVKQIELRIIKNFEDYSDEEDENIRKPAIC